MESWIRPVVFLSTKHGGSSEQSTEDGNALLVPTEEKGLCNSHAVLKHIYQTLTLWTSDLKGSEESLFVLNSIVLQAPVYPLPK